MGEYTPNDIIDNIPVWDNHPRPVIGLTPFGYYDDDTQFQSDAPRIAKYIANSLGYPMVDIELQDVNIYTSFEDAIYTYTSLVNQYKIQETLLDIKGSPTDVDLTTRQIKTSLGAVINIAKDYGSEAGSGGNIDYHKGYITVSENQQTYDLNVWAEQNVPGKTIEIKKVYHSEPPAVSRYNGFNSGAGVGNTSMLSEFGWDNMSPAVTFVLRPVYEDLLRLQAIEFNNMVRQSAYSFKLINNNLTIFPTPIQGITRIYFDYIIVEERNSAIYDNDNGNSTTDYSNAPFNIIRYSDINQPGKEWIRNYTLACTKIVLGEIRSKYSSIPIPDSEINLDGETLRSEGEQLKNELLGQLRELLEKMTKANQLEVKSTEAEHLSNILNNVPMLIYVK